MGAMVWGLPAQCLSTPQAGGAVDPGCCLAFVCLSVCPSTAHTTWDAAQSPERGCMTRADGEDSSPAQASEHLPRPCWEHHLPPALMPRCQREQGPRGPGMPLGRGHRDTLKSQRLLSCLLSPAWARRGVTAETLRALRQPGPARPPPTVTLSKWQGPCLSVSSSASQLHRPVSAAQACVWGLPNPGASKPGHGVPTGATTLAKTWGI